MASFRKLCEEMKVGRDLWNSSKDLDPQARSVIERGLEIRPDRTDGNTFWDDFISVIANNSDAASHLLGVSSAVVSRWSLKIKQGVEMVREKNSSKEMKTGDQATTQ